METFYNGLNEPTRVMVDAAANGALLAKSYNEANEILERMATNHYQWPTERLPTRKTPGVLEVDAIIALSAQVSNLTNMIKNMNTSTGVKTVQALAVSCVYCGEGHLFEECPLNPASACYVSNYNRNNAYNHQHNQGWKQHPNFSWNNQGAGPSGASQYNRPAPQQGLAQPSQPMRIQAGESSNSMENFFKEYITKNEAKMQSYDSTLRSLETQIGQLANALNNRPQGTLPSNTENPRRDGKDHCNAIILRSGKALEQPKEKKELDEEPSSIQTKERQDVCMNPAQPQDEAEPSVAAAKQHQQRPDQQHQTLSFVDKQSPAVLQQQSKTTTTCQNNPTPPFPQRFQKKQQDK